MADGRKSDVDNTTLGKRLRMARQACDLTQEALAELIGFDASGISKVEAGSRRLSAVDLGKWARATNVSVEALLSPEPFAVYVGAVDGEVSA